MYAIINGKAIKVKVVNGNYSDTSVEVMMLSGNFKGVLTIVNKEDIRGNITSDTKRVIVCKQGIHNNKIATGVNNNKLRVNKSGNVEAYVWSDRAKAMILLTLKQYEVKAI